MALPPTLGAEGLARFRTKRCERILALGCCSFGAKCQYSHDGAWLRRNPRKHIYQPALCPDAQNGCSQGVACGMAHSIEEVMYHPLKYKTVVCEAGSLCADYYCPFVHDAAAETRRTPNKDDAGQVPPRRRRGRAGCRGVDEGVPPSNDQAEVDRAAGGQRVAAAPNPTPKQELGTWWQFDQIWVATDGSARDADATPVGAALLGGRMNKGRFKPNDSSEAVECVVKVVAAGRKEHVEAAKVLKELKRWTSFGSVPRTYEMKRTVATICVAMPQCPSLSDCVSARQGSSQTSLADQLSANWTLSAVAAAWCQQLLEEVKQLHSEGMSHMCICPATVLLDADGVLRLGDFLGKIRALQLLSRGYDDEVGDDVWAMWYPAEVQAQVRRVTGNRDEGDKQDADQSSRLSLQKVDAWQVGVVICYMLCGEHPFGDLREPATVCRNIADCKPVNAQKLDHLPVFKHLVDSCLAHCAKHRASPSELLQEHPMFWSAEDVVKRIPAPSLPEGEVDHLRHVPALALLGGPRPPTGIAAGLGLRGLATSRAPSPTQGGSASAAHPPCIPPPPGLGSPRHAAAVASSSEATLPSRSAPLPCSSPAARAYSSAAPLAAERTSDAHVSQSSGAGTTAQTCGAAMAAKGASATTAAQMADAARSAKKVGVARAAPTCDTIGIAPMVSAGAAAQVATGVAVARTSSAVAATQIPSAAAVSQVACTAIEPKLASTFSEVAQKGILDVAFQSCRLYFDSDNSSSVCYVYYKDPRNPRNSALPFTAAAGKSGLRGSVYQLHMDSDSSVCYVKSALAMDQVACGTISPPRLDAVNAAVSATAFHAEQAAAAASVAAEPWSGFLRSFAGSMCPSAIVPAAGVAANPGCFGAHYSADTQLGIGGVPSASLTAVSSLGCVSACGWGQTLLGLAPAYAPAEPCYFDSHLQPRWARGLQVANPAEQVAAATSRHFASI